MTRLQGKGKRAKTLGTNINKKKRMNKKSYVGKRMSEEVLREPRVMESRCTPTTCEKLAKRYCSDISEAKEPYWEEKSIYTKS